MNFLSLPKNTQEVIKKAAGELKCLFAEDDARFQDLFSRHFLDPLGFKEVWRSKDGEHAFELYRQHKHNLIITDFDMPRMCGTELVRECDEFARNNSIKPPIIVFLSRYHDAVAIKELLRGMEAQIIHKQDVLPVINTENARLGGAPKTEADIMTLWSPWIHSILLASDIKKAFRDRRRIAKERRSRQKTPFRLTNSPVV